jgi:hypothetical protein
MIPVVEVSGCQMTTSRASRNEESLVSGVVCGRQDDVELMKCVMRVRAIGTMTSQWQP